ncbi:MAG: acyl-CoA dehydrogenase family protein [Actinobacteria bacterium]|nr:acyl-CoA dehydrogenase family protein [Actinomycetota bacterium]
MGDGSPTTDERRLVADRVARLVADRPPATTSAAEFWAARFDAGLAWVGFPPGCGGMGVAAGLQVSVDDLLERAGAPSNWSRNPVGLGAAAAALSVHGTDEQRRRWLRPLFTCEEVWCQLYSEPGAGSDLAALATTAVPVGGPAGRPAWAVTGHKAHSTLAHVARWGLLLARTDASGPRHRGITCFALDMAGPGVEVRPVRQADGDAEFCEVLLAGAEVPDDSRIGPVGEGWSVAVTTLLHERLALSGPARARGAGPIAEALRIWGTGHGPGDAGDPVRRDRLAGLWIDAEVTRLLVARARAAVSSGSPGPEGAVAKLATAEVDQRVWELCVDLLGPEGSLYDTWAPHLPAAAGESRRDPRRAWLRSRALTIQGGTSEVVRTLLAERVLGLPRDTGH